MIRWLVPSLLASGVLTGCSCQPELPPPNDKPDETIDTSDSDPLIDTAPPPPCQVPEEEDNDRKEDGNILEMEQLGCGDLQEPADFDYWLTEVGEEGWLRIQLKSRSLGEIANVHLLVEPEGLVAARRIDDEGTTDASLLFPAPAGNYSIQVSDQALNGDTDRYHYEVFVSRAKAPLEWTRHEVEDNNAFETAEEVFAGDAIFGGSHEPLDNDWYKISVPAGKHTLTVDVDAFTYGSAGDYSIWLYDDQLRLLPLGCVQCEHQDSPGEIHDPIVTYDSLGDEVLYWRIVESDQGFGDAKWYVMNAILEGL